MKTTNCSDTFIQVADDCPVLTAEVPPVKNGSKTAANIQYEMIKEQPYKYTSDDVVFGTFAYKNNIAEDAQTQAREQFFSKGQPCLRSSPLGKRYGWGVHSDSEGRVALYAVESMEYGRLAKDPAVKPLKAMRSKRA